MNVVALPGPLSVVMPVRDAGPYLDEAVRSILAQTYGDFEFVIRDDGSVDGSTDRLRRWAERDRRIRLHVGERPLGPAASSNWVVAQTSTPLVARMDADDVSHPDRLRRQIEALERAPEACLVGTLWEGIDAAGRRVRPRDRWSLTRSTPFAPCPHGSIMFRRRAFDAAGGYRSDCDFWEDADLLLRLARIGPVIILPEALYSRRWSRLSTRLVSPCERVEGAIDRMYRATRGLGPPREGPDEPARLVPQVFVAMGSMHLWAGHRPRMVRRLWRRGALSADLSSLAALAWTLWSRLSPGSLRAALRLLIRTRDLAARGRVADGVAHPWRPPLPAEGEAEGAPTSVEPAPMRAGLGA